MTKKIQEDYCGTCGEHIEDCISCESDDESDDESEEEEEPNRCDKCDWESYNESSLCFPGLGDGYYCAECCGKWLLDAWDEGLITIHRTADKERGPYANHFQFRHD